MVSKRSCVPESKGRRTCGGAFGSHRAGSIILILAAIVVLGCGYLLAAESTEPNLGEPLSSREPARADMRYRVFSLRHISAEKGKEFLAEAKIGTVSHLSGTNMLLVTALPKELIKAGAILKLVDSKEQYVMKTISPASAAQNYLANEQIQAELGNILIGTFANPPTGIGQTKAIIDVHDESIVAITPADQLERIASAFRQAQVLRVPLPKNGGTETVQLGAVATDALILAEPNHSVEPNIGTLGISAQPTPQDESYLMEMARQFIARERAESKSAALRETAPAGELVAQADANESDANGLFNRLLSSLAQAEKKAAGEQAPPEIMSPEGVLKPSEPNEPGLIVVVPMPNEPGVGAGVPAANEPGAGVGVLAVNEPNVFVVPTPEANVLSEPSIISKEPTDRLQSIALAEILRRIQALEGGIEAGPAPRPTPEIKPLAPKIEHPNEVSIEEVPAEIEQPNDVNEASEPEHEDGLYDPEPLPNGKDVLKIQLPETLPMIDFLSFMGEHLQLDYLYDPAEVKGNVTLRFQGRLRGEIRVEELYPLLENVMQFHGFVMTRKEGSSIVTIRKTDKIDSLTPILVRGKGDKLEAGDVIITRIFELEHADPVSAQNLLTNMKLGTGVTPVPEAGTLVVTNYASNMSRIEELLGMIDKPGEPKQFRFRQLKYTMATVLASKVEKLVQQLGEVSVTVARTAEKAPTPRRDARGRITRQRPTRTTKPKPGQPQPSQATVYLDFDERTNRILMIGRADQLDVVEELIDALDVAQQDLRTLRVYEIQYIDAEEVRKKLGELGIIGGVETTPRRPGRREQPTRKPTPKGKAPPKSQPPPTASTAGVEQPLVEEP
ncbi:MAG: secretin N-terminal domain-containing protein, partial [Planctomycetota bacterium]